MYNYLKYCQQTLPKTIEIRPWFVFVGIKIKFTAKHLHTQKGKNYNEKK